MSNYKDTTDCNSCANLKTTWNTEACLSCGSQEDNYSPSVQEQEYRATKAAVAVILILVIIFL